MAQDISRTTDFDIVFDIVIIFENVYFQDLALVNAGTVHIVYANLWD